MKHEWRKQEKHIYLPKNRPELIEIPKFNYFSIQGEGDPNKPEFTEFIGVLYSLSYAVKMSYKKGISPKGYYDYTVYPLEGVWDITEEAKQRKQETFNKDDLVFTLMMRQPDFVTKDFAKEILTLTQKKKPHDILRAVTFKQRQEGSCVQMLHLGSYDNEPESFSIMEEFAKSQNVQRVSKVHKEIYLTDSRKTPPEKLKTVLRFQVE